MGEFKLFMESVVPDISALCKAIKDAPEKQKKEHWQILLEVYPQIVDNDLKYNTLVDLFKDMDSPFAEVTLALDHFVNTGVSGFATFDKSCANFILYRGGKLIPKLSLAAMSDRRNGIQYFGTVPFKKEYCDKAIEGQMSLTQYAINNKVQIDNVDMEKIDLISSFNHNSDYHDLQGNNTEESPESHRQAQKAEFARLVRDHFRHSIRTTTSVGAPGASNHINVISDFEDYENLLRKSHPHLTQLYNADELK